jgi:hypothetical protein
LINFSKSNNNRKRIIRVYFLAGVKKIDEWILGTVGKTLSQEHFRKVIYLAKIDNDVLEPEGL